MADLRIGPALWDLSNSGRTVFKEDTLSGNLIWTIQVELGCYRVTMRGGATACSNLVEMNRINNTNGHAESHAQRLVNNQSNWLLSSNRGVQWRIDQRVKPLASWIVYFVLFFSLCFSARAGWLKADVDFSNYDTPLYEQMVNRIKDKVAARLGEVVNKNDRYFIVPFAFQKRGNNPQFSHSFISVIRVLGDGKQPTLTPGLRRGQYKNRAFEAFTISWVPHDYGTNPVCVFDGFGSRIFATWNKCPVVDGKNFRLEETLKVAMKEKGSVCMWGPYEIRKEAFELGVNRMRLLDGGTIRYKADDRITRRDRVAINCFHAMANLEELYPNGGFLGTGFQMWGINGTARVLVEYTKAARNKGLLLQPVNIKKDLYGFVYAPERKSGGLYNPFPNASAYHQ
jgi:hypothetical protein